MGQDVLSHFAGMLGSAQSAEQESDTLADCNEADSNGNNHGQQTDNFSQNTGQHLTSNDGGQNSGSSLRTNLLS